MCFTYLIGLNDLSVYSLRFVCTMGKKLLS